MVERDDPGGLPLGQFVTPFPDAERRLVAFVGSQLAQPLSELLAQHAFEGGQRGFRRIHADYS
jgi:hypothetical protein